MWTAFRPTGDDGHWYSAATEYWETEANCATTIDGMLGGFASISPTDVKGSSEFLKNLNLPSTATACDCGAGIGRVTRDFLLPAGFSTVDLVEVSPRLSAASPDFIGAAASRCRFFCIGMQDFTPAPGKYDVIWIQWVIGHLDDRDCVAFLQRCLAGLTPTGVVCVKDNATEADAFVVDCDDSSVTRSMPYLEKIFDVAGCEIVRKELQKDFPEEIYKVPQYALRRKQC
jgi:protein N-terminal methyltransferase